MTLDRIKDRVEQDFARVTDTDDPWRILGLPSGASFERINEQFQTFEDIYRAENIQRLEDKDLTRKALQVRKRVNRAVVEVQGKQRAKTQGEEAGLADTSSVRTVVDPDSQALAEIYFNDGITWLFLEDLDSAIDCFERSVEQDPSQGLTVAYLAYARFQRNPRNHAVIQAAEDSFKTASNLEPQNADLFALVARFAIGAAKPKLAADSLARMRRLEPGHPDLGELRRLYDEMADNSG